MTDFVIECGELYLQYFPHDTWEQAMDVITTDCKLSRHIQEEVLRRRRNAKNYI